MTGDTDLLARFEAARRRGNDPLNAAGTSVMVTTIDSDWFALRCRTCGHTFRTDDQVTVTYDEAGKRRDTRHLDPMLGCAPADPATVPPASDGLTTVARFWAAFQAAIEQADQQDQEQEPDHGATAPPQPLVRLRPGSPQLEKKPQRDRCKGCADTLRPYETVVVCPCGKDCQAAIHQDITSGLTCYEAMFRRHHTVMCLITDQPREA